MASHNKIEVDSLVKAAEAGQGCSILNVFKGQSLQDQLAAMCELGKDKFLSADVSNFGHRYTSGQVNLDLRVTGGFMNIFGKQLFSESFDPVKGTIDYTCTDYNSELYKTNERSETEKF